MGKKNFAKLQEILNSCVNSGYTGQLVINFNNGNVCQPVFLQYKIDKEFSLPIQVSGKLIINAEDGKTDGKTVIKQRVWLQQD